MLKSFPHVVDKSPWPILVGMNSLSLMLSFLLMFKIKNTIIFSLTSLIFIFLLFHWWRDVTRESTFQGSHSLWVINALKSGMVLFIISEVMFFFSFFWGYFHSSLGPSFILGDIWPPYSMVAIQPFSIPLLNTMILLSSGVSVTWCHYNILINSHKDSLISLVLTIFLGLYFILLQLFEYGSSFFSFADSIYGSLFFIATGFHGFHVMIGTMFLSVMLFRLFYSQFSMTNHLGFEFSTWYWHFVDVVWLFLFISIYWWGN